MELRVKVHKIAHSLGKIKCKSLPNLTDTAYLKDVRSPAGITKSAGEAQGSSRLSNAVLGPGQAKATCLPALAALHTTKLNLLNIILVKLK